MKFITNENVSEKVKNQFYEIAKKEIYKDCEMALMPDAHYGKTPIGLVMRFKEKQVNPDYIGSDIGCTISLIGTNIKIENEKEMAENFDKAMQQKAQTNKTSENIALKILKGINAKIDVEKALYTFGTIGGGNHFLEAYNDNGYLSIGIHTGSRTLGGMVYKYYKNLNKNLQSENYKERLNNLIQSTKPRDRQQAIIKFNEDYRKESHECLVGKDFDNYLEDVMKCCEFALQNQMEIAYNLVGCYSCDVENSIFKPHNFIRKDGEAYILRKGSQEAKAGQEVLIPINMRDGIIAGNVKYYPDKRWLDSLNHGAGRVMSRREAKENLDLEEFKEQMKGVYGTSVSENTLDEAPGTYKSLEFIKESVKDQIDIMTILKPFWNYKGQD